MRVADYKELRVYKLAFESAMEIFELSKKFPSEEKFSLTDQIRRSSRSVCANMAEAWRKRRYEVAFVSKLSDAEADRSPAQAVRCGDTTFWTLAVISRSYKDFDEWQRVSDTCCIGSRLGSL